MNYLCSVPNQTYATLNLNDEKTIEIKGNEILGFLGRKVDDLLIKKHLRKCNLIGEDNLGERLDNGTWTGNLGSIQRGDAILYLKSEAPLIDTSIEKWMHYLFPFYREKFVIVQEISHDIKNSYKEKSSEVLNCFDFGLIFLFLFIFANLISFSIWILFKLFSSYQNFRKKRRKRKRISIRDRIKKILINLLNGQWNLNYSKLTKISLFILFYSLHIWFIELMISNNIKTDKVIVDHSILIKDENDALLTERLFCFNEGETELSIALNSNSNILSKLYNQKNILTKKLKGSNFKIGSRCIFKKNLEQLNLELRDIFTIFSENMVWLVTSLIGNLRTGDILWFDSKPIFEMDYQMIIKNQQDLIDSYNRIILLYTESGLFKKLFDSFSSNSNAYLNSHIVYRTIEDFINDNSKFTALNTDSFKLLFIIYVSFCLIILIINLLHYLFIKKINVQN